MLQPDRRSFYYGWVPGVFSGNFLYPSTWGSTMAVEFSQPVTNFTMAFFDKNRAGERRMAAGWTGLASRAAAEGKLRVVRCESEWWLRRLRCPDPGNGIARLASARQTPRTWRN
jgi:hypothetical protein